MSSALPSHLRPLHTMLRSLDGWAYTDFERARQVLEELSETLPPDAPVDLRAAYHRYMAFLENQWQRYDTAVEHANQVVRLLEGRTNPDALLEAWADLAAPEINRRNWPAAQSALDRARRFITPETAEPLRGLVACRDAFFHLLLGNTTPALTSFQEAEKCLMNLNENAPLKFFYLQTLLYSGLGDLYERLGDRENSLEAYRRVLPIVEAHRLRPRRAWHYLNAGRAALAGDDTRAARLFFEKALDFAAESDTDARSLALGNLGILASLNDEPERALSLLGEAAAQYEKPAKESDFTNLSKIETWRAGLIMQNGDEAAAERQLEKAYAFGEKGHDRQHQAQICLNLATLNAQNNRFEQAYKWQLRANELNTEYFNILRNRERQELEVRYQLERSRQEAQLARFRVAGLQLRALRSQMNPHFLFNALNAIQGLITSGRNAEAGDYLAKFARMMRHTLEYSDLEVVTLEQELEFLERYLDINRKLRFRSRLQYKLVQPPGQDADDIFVPTMIVQPFVENAIEHGLRPKQEGNLLLEFHLSPEGDTITCIIEDDGIGYNRARERQMNAPPEFQQHRSRGMDITRERLVLLHQLQHRTGESFINIIDLEEYTGGQRTGTRVEVILPVMDSDEE